MANSIVIKSYHFMIQRSISCQIENLLCCMEPSKKLMSKITNKERKLTISLKNPQKTIMCFVNYLKVLLNFSVVFSFAEFCVCAIYECH